MRRIADKWFEDGQSWIYWCPTCFAMFSSKAMPGRSLFPYFGYHPNDGNKKIVSDEIIYQIELRGRYCDCPTRIQKVDTHEQLLDALLTYSPGAEMTFFLAVAQVGKFLSFKEECRKAGRYSVGGAIDAMFGSKS